MRCEKQLALMQRICLPRDLADYQVVLEKSGWNKDMHGNQLSVKAVFLLNNYPPPVKI